MPQAQTRLGGQIKGGGYLGADVSQQAIPVVTGLRLEHQVCFQYLLITLVVIITTIHGSQHRMAFR